jgi:hypothetical protein
MFDRPPATVNEEPVLVHSISYNSPLEIVLALSSGAGALLLIAERAATVRKKWAEARTSAAKSRSAVARTETSILEERLRQEAVQIILTELESGRNELALWRKHALSRQGAEALLRIEQIEKLD